MYQLQLADLQTDYELKEALETKDTMKFYAGLTNSVIMAAASFLNLENIVQQYIRLRTDYLKNEVHEIKLDFLTK